MDISQSDLEHGEKFLVKIVNGTRYKLSGILVDENGEEYENSPEIRLWAGHNTALRKSNFGEFAEVELMAVGLRKGQLRARILESSDDKQFRKSVHRDWVRKLTYRKKDYDSPLPELTDEELSIDPPNTDQEQQTEGIDSKHTEDDDEWDTRKSDTMNDLPDL